MGDFTIYNVPNHDTAERLSAREQDLVAAVCDEARAASEPVAVAAAS